MRWLGLIAAALVSVVVGAHTGGGAADAQPNTLPTVAETLPALSIEDVTRPETNVDTGALLAVTLTPASTETVTVHWATADGTADSTDYVADSGVLTFTPGMTTALVAVLIKGDALNEADETIYVDLSDAEHATISKPRGVVTINDDDPSLVFPVDATVRASWDVHRNYTRVTRLVVTRAPDGATFEALCAGRGCPFREKQVGRKLTGLFRGAKLRPGARIQVWIDAPGTIGKAFLYTIRASKAPRAKTLCLPAGATKPAPC